MKRVLLLPLLQIPSGHHQTANAVMDTMKKMDEDINFFKRELLSYTFGNWESLISTIYLKWIHLLPGTYSWLYKKSVYEDLEKGKRFKSYEKLFMTAMKRLLKETNPDLIICTHALPSYLLDKMKKRNEVAMPVINIYTDFFIHKIWGVDFIDYHLVSHPDMAEFLVNKGVAADQIFTTGIPVHPNISKSQNTDKHIKEFYHVLVSGGSLGAGTISKMCRQIDHHEKVKYFILCGNNKRLFKKLSSMNKAEIIPLGYICDRSEMDQLYDKVDAIITKPGGVTISESLVKRIPIFIYHSLPGQEEINCEMLEKLQVIYNIQDWKSNELSHRLFSTLNDESEMARYKQRVDHYHERILSHHYKDAIHTILQSI